MIKFDLEWALQESRKVQGFLRTGEEELLYKFALEKPNGTQVYEIGSWRGRSTILLASACKFSENGWVLAIDPHKKPERLNIKPAYDLWAEQNVNDTHEDFCANIVKADVDDYINPVRMTSEELGLYMNKQKEKYPDYKTLELNKIGFLFIDGCHQKDFVEKDFDLFEPFVVNGGCIAFHDSSPGNADYYESAGIVAEEKLIKSGKFKSCGRFKSLTYGYKK